MFKTSRFNGTLVICFNEKQDAMTYYQIIILSLKVTFFFNGARRLDKKKPI